MGSDSKVSRVVLLKVRGDEVAHPSCTSRQGNKNEGRLGCGGKRALRELRRLTSAPHWLCRALLSRATAATMKPVCGLWLPAAQEHPASDVVARVMEEDGLWTGSFLHHAGFRVR